MKKDFINEAEFKIFTKKKNRISRSALAGILAILLLTLSFPQSVLAEDDPYDTYIYDYWEEVVPTPAAYEPTGIISGRDLTYQGESIGSFVNPQDLCKSEDGCIYVADTGNHRIVVLNPAMTEVVNIYETFVRDGEEDSFNMPTGVCISEKNWLYIADSMNRRVVILDVATGELMGIVSNPQSDILEEGYVFTPLKVSVDYADRVYCIAQNMFQGIMVFESNGEFTGFFGTIEVKISLWEKFWRRIATKEERSKSQLFIPTEFTGIDVDSAGFVYATNIDLEGEQAVRRLNPRGEDVLRQGENGNVGGDLWISGATDFSGPSQITDIVYRDKGIYSLLDRRRGRIFTYDHEGNLLYIFGGLGTQEGTFLSPVAIESVGNYIVVLDSNRGMITQFTATEYGRLINEAVGLRYDGDETQAVALWQEVLRINENFELANVGIGKAYLTAGENELAMYYLRLGMSREYYSIAFKRYRNDILKENLSYLLTGMVVIVIGYVIYSKRKEKQTGKEKEGMLDG